MQKNGTSAEDHNTQFCETAPRPRMKSPFLCTKQAGAYVGLSNRTLEKMRCHGGGPDYRKHGRYVRYHIDDLDAWSAAHAQHSTAHT